MNDVTYAQLNLPSARGPLPSIPASSMIHSSENGTVYATVDRCAHGQEGIYGTLFNNANIDCLKRLSLMSKLRSKQIKRPERSQIF